MGSTTEWILAGKEIRIDTTAAKNKKKNRKRASPRTGIVHYHFITCGTKIKFEATTKNKNDVTCSKCLKIINE